MNKCMIFILLALSICLFSLHAEKSFDLHTSDDVVFSSNLPILKIDTFGQEIEDTERVKVQLSAIYDEEGDINYSDSQPDHFIGSAEIEIRGSSSQNYPKKQYSFELVEEDRDNLNFPLLGLPKENDWILYASYNDKSLIRNVLVHDLFKSMGNYSSRTKYCELFINDEYVGIYILMEKIKRDKNRVDISKLTDDENSGDDLTGGYIIKIDKLTGDNNDGWDSEYSSTYYQYHYPKPNNITNAQKDYIQSYISDFESLMNDQDYNNLEEGYLNLIDLQSFIRVYIINEFSRNVDGYRLSTYLYKDKDSKDPRLHMGPIWDYDRSFGGSDTCIEMYTEGWFIEEFGSRYSIPFWMKKIWNDQHFRDEFNRTWNYYRANLLSDNNLKSIVDNHYSSLLQAQVRNFEKWPILFEDVAPYPDSVTGEYEEHVEYLKEWMIERAHWMDEHTGFSVEQSDMICINEFLNDQNNIISDSNNEFDDWIELYNYSDKPIDLNGMYLTDDVNNPTKFKIASDREDDMIIAPGEYKIFWADNDPEQGCNHLNFKLSSSGEQICIFDRDGVNTIDYVSYPSQTENISFGRYPDGSSNWLYFDLPTPGKENRVLSDDKIKTSAYPNPFNSIVNIEFTLSKESDVEIDIYNIKGQLVRILVDRTYETGIHKVVWDGKSNERDFVASGVYFYKLKTDHDSIIKKMLLVK